MQNPRKNLSGPAVSPFAVNLDLHVMNDEDKQSLEQRLLAQRAQALRRLQHGQVLQKHGAEMEREARIELDELETTQRVLVRLASEQLELAATAREKLLGVAAAGTSWAPSGVSSAISASELYTLASSRRQKALVAEHCMNALADGSWKSTEELVAGLEGYVQITASNKAQRVSQILSADERFQAQRGKGWALKTHHKQSDEANDFENKLRTQARQVVRDGDRNR